LTRSSELVEKKEKSRRDYLLGGDRGAPALLERCNRFNMEGKLPIVAFDGDPEDTGMDRTGRNYGHRHAKRPYVMSYLRAKVLGRLTPQTQLHQFKDWRTALAPPMPTSVDTGTVVVDKNNLQLYIAKL